MAGIAIRQEGRGGASAALPCRARPQSSEHSTHSLRSLPLPQSQRGAKTSPAVEGLPAEDTSKYAVWEGNDTLKATLSYCERPTS
jgi:hypothetical protein